MDGHFYQHQLSLSAVATSLPLLKSHEFAEAITWILHEFRQALANNNDTVILDPHNLASLAYAALQVDHTSEAHQSIESLLYFALPDLFQPDRTSQGMSPIELIFDVASAASIANFMTSAAGYRLLGDPSTWKLFQSILSQDLKRFDLSLVKPLADLFSKYFARRLAGTMDTKPVEAFIQGQTGRLLEAELGPTASFINLGMSLGLDTQPVTEVLGNMEMDMVDQAGRTLIHASAARGLDQAIQYLATTSASKLIAVGDNEGRTPLHEAAESDFPYTVKALLEAGAQADVADKDGRTPLHEAVEKGYSLDTVKALLEAGAQADVADKDGRTPLHEAAESDFPYTVKALLEAGAQADVADKNGRTPLHEAAESDFPHTVKALLEAGAQADVADKDGRTPLHEAAEKGYSSDIVKALLEAGAQTDVADKDGRTPLHEAAEKGYSLDVAKALLEAGAEADVADKDGRTPLHEAAEKGYSSDIVKALLEAGAEVYVADKDGRTPLHEAAKRYSSDIVKALLEAGAEADVADKDGRTPLHEAAEKGYSSDVVKALLEAGAEADVADKDGRTPLHEAAKMSSSDAVKALLEAGAEANVADKDGRTPLHEAAKRYSSDIVKALLEAGAEADVADKDGRTPLHEAAKMSSSDAVKALLEAGAQADVADKDGRTPLHEATEKGYSSDIVKALLEAGAQADVADKDGRTPLHEAAESDFPHTVKALLEAGAQADVADKDGRTPLHEATEKGYSSDIVKALLEAGAEADVADKDGRTPLHEATEKGYSLDTVKAFLEAGAQADVADKDGRTPLHEAAKMSSSDAVKALLEAGAEADVADKDGRTPLHEATEKGYSLDTVKAFLEAGAQADVADKDGRTPLHEAAKMSSSDAVKALLEAGAQADVADKDGRTPLHEAAKMSSSDAVKALLEAGAEANVTDNEGRTPLFIAVQKDISSYYPLFIDLAEHWLKLRPYIATELPSVPSRAVVDTLLNFKANTQLSNTEGLTVFHVAAQGSSTGCLQLLLNHLDTKADMQDCRGDTPLHLAIETGSYPNAALLTLKYTSFLINNHEGMTPLDVASKRSRKALWILIRAARLSQITKPNKHPEDPDMPEDPDWPEDYFAQASKKILSILRKATMRSRVPRYQMLDNNRGTIRRLQTFPLGRSSTSIPARAKREVRERLKATNHRGWAVLCVSLGVTHDDAVPAIVVIHPLAEKLWEDVSSSIGDGVEYLIEKGSISRQSNLISELRMFQNEPRNGSSIGSVSTDSRWGSLGGYLRLKDGDVLAMTCGHVLTRGDRLDTTTACVQPSFYHHNNHLHRTCLQEFLNNHGQWNYTCSTPATCPYFGLVDRICTRTLSVSCERAAEPELVTISIDWAILKNLSRPARRNTIHGRAVRGWRAILYTVNGKGEIEVGNGQKVFMQGARSGEVQGILTSRLVECCLEGNSEETQEIGIIGCDGKSFSAQGDSGSWVIEVDEDEQGNGSVIGVLLGGYYDGTACFSLITPMEHLLKDIEETIGSKIDFPEWGSTHS
ncbi:Ankyrin-1 [Fusarium oxysporum f. sp. matthiolae]|nr:Ankyrin-1 [Fusarium oxysporum f. sp. matthiolae]